MQRIVGKQWDNYRELVIPKTAGETQIAETRRAFYAGALLVYEAVIRIGELDISEEAGLTILDIIGAEIRAFTSEQLEQMRRKES
jgi:hypothetical protein